MLLQSRAINLSGTISTGDVLKTMEMDINQPQVHGAGKANTIDPNSGSNDSWERDAMNHLDAEFMTSITFGGLIEAIYDDQLKSLAHRVGRLFTRGPRR